VARSDETENLAALEEARVRLEAALASDENWRALQQSPRDDVSEERRARDTRLRMALDANPLFRAWTHVTAEIGDVGDGTGGPAPATQGALEEAPAAEPKRVPFPEASELPEEILALIRAGTPQAGEHSATSHDRDAATAASGQTDRDHAPPGPPRAIEDGANSAHAGPFAEAPEPADSKQDDAPAKTPEEAPFRSAVEPDEATVTFVIRESLLPSAELASDLGTERVSALFSRLRQLDQEPEEPPNTFFPSTIENEAEVTIVTPRSAEKRKHAEEREGAVQRFLKALSGD
jgi:hypothetical protein